MQEYFPGIRLEHSANYLSASGTSLRFGQGVVNSWLCTDSPHNLWQVCYSKTSRIKWKGAAPTSPCLPRTPPVKASQVRNCPWQLVPGLWEFEQLHCDTKQRLHLGLGDCGVSVWPPSRTGFLNLSVCLSAPSSLWNDTARVYAFASLPKHLNHGIDYAEEWFILPMMIKRVCLPLRSPSTQSKVYGEIRSNIHILPPPFPAGLLLMCGS